MSPIKFKARGLFLLLALASPLGAQTLPTTVILVRHSEKADTPKADPPLSAVGRERAEALLDAVRHAGLSVVYSTPKLRNLETARFVANALQIPVIETPIDGARIDQYAQDIARRVKTEGNGRVSLVVGHSNTYAPVIKALGGPAIEEIPDPRYDDAFVLTVQDGKPVKMLRLKYGRRFSPEAK